jgi:hypothetical protein
MYAVSKRYSRHISAFISLGLLALSPRLIYYSSELKQYSGDVAVALLLLLVVPNCLENTPKPRAFVALGIAGSLAIWLSYPSLFVLAAIGLTLGVAFAIQRDIYRLSWLIGIGAVWAANLALTYVVNLRYLESNDNLTNYWIGTFAPLPPWSNLGWYSNAFIDMLNDPATLPISAITTGIVFLGVVSFAFRRWALMLVLLIPFLLTLIASALGKYPFSGRLLLFLMPLLLLLLAEGAELFQKVLLRVNRPMAGLAYASLVVYLLYGPVDAAYKNVQSPPLVEHIKATMSYMSKRYLRTDVIYVYYGARPAFEFYAPLYGFESADYIIGSSSRKDPSKYIADIEQLEGKRRVWFIFTHNCSFCTVNEQNFILKHLNKIGSKKDEYISDGTAVYLYDLGQSP